MIMDSKDKCLDTEYVNIHYDKTESPTMINQKAMLATKRLIKICGIFWRK